MTNFAPQLGALTGVRVLDATQMLAGPLAATRLGDLGADVIKLEPPVKGEFNRTHGFEDVKVNGEMTTFLAVNRNKRSLAIDLKSAESGSVIEDLVRHSDVFIQNFRHGTAERLGVGYEQLKQLNPKLIYCSISGYGSFGPYRDRPGQDLIVQGYSGSMFSVGSADDTPAPGALWAAVRASMSRSTCSPSCSMRSFKRS
jgi:crotonobetainyl-CoA:carnitine CoA-transferase CaiB-like acyl-CoA transferase